MKRREFLKTASLASLIGFGVTNTAKPEEVELQPIFSNDTKTTCSLKWDLDHLIDSPAFVQNLETIQRLSHRFRDCNYNSKIYKDTYPILQNHWKPMVLAVSEIVCRHTYQTLVEQYAAIKRFPPNPDMDAFLWGAVSNMYAFDFGLFDAIGWPVIADELEIQQRQLLTRVGRDWEQHDWDKNYGTFITPPKNRVLILRKPIKVRFYANSDGAVLQLCLDYTIEGEPVAI